MGAQSVHYLTCLHAISRDKNGDDEKKKRIVGVFELVRRLL